MNGNKYQCEYLQLGLYKMLYLIWILSFLPVAAEPTAIINISHSSFLFVDADMSLRASADHLTRTLLKKY